MCVIFFAFKQHPQHPLIFIANRDEFYERATAASAFWEDHPEVFAGRDLVGGGTWLGVTRRGRFAAVTNYRDPSAPKGVRSRGALVADFLKAETSAKNYLEQVQYDAEEYSGFNLLVGEIGETSGLFYYANRGAAPRELAPGIYGLSNHLLDTPWPKVVNGKAAFTRLIDSGDISDERFFELLSDKTLADDNELPSTGVSYEAEKAISAIFIETPGYGTRCSTVVKFDENFEWSFNEKVFV
ncbi:MAG: NRDE family protein [Pyrinomonadaceae bacterium]